MPRSARSASATSTWSGTRREPTAGKAPDSPSRRHGGRLPPWSRIELLERLLDGTRQGEQPAFDRDRDLAHISDSLATLLEDAGVPGNLVGRLFHLGGIRIRVVLQLAQPQRLGTHSCGEILLLARKTL